MTPISPLVSIIIPCYNHESYVKDAIQSIIDQTYENIELIVIDDGSQDQSVARILELSDICEQRFDKFYFKTRPNKGVCATLNEALALCHGKYVCIIASDDLMLAHKTQLQVNFLENNPEVAGVFGGVELINDKGECIEERISTKTQYSLDEVMLSKHDLPAPTQMYRLSIIQEQGGYDENINIEDWDMLLRLIKSNHILIYIPEKLGKYRCHGDNFSKNDLKMAVEMMKVLEKFKDEKQYTQVMYQLNRTVLKEKFRKSNRIKYYVFRLVAWVRYTLT